MIFPKNNQESNTEKEKKSRTGKTNLIIWRPSL